MMDLVRASGSNARQDTKATARFRCSAAKLEGRPSRDDLSSLFLRPALLFFSTSFSVLFDALQHLVYFTTPLAQASTFSLLSLRPSPLQTCRPLVVAADVDATRWWSPPRIPHPLVAPLRPFQTQMK